MRQTGWESPTSEFNSESSVGGREREHRHVRMPISWDPLASDRERQRAQVDFPPYPFCSQETQRRRSRSADSGFVSYLHYPTARV